MRPGADRIADLRGSTATEEEFRRLAPQCICCTWRRMGSTKLKTQDAAPDEDGRGSAAGGLDDLVTYAPHVLSGLALAGANNPPAVPDDPAKFSEMPDDGLLTAEEIAVLPLGAAQLVVLSACESGLGEAARGEGVLGIQRAFQVAGAPNDHRQLVDGRRQSYAMDHGAVLPQLPPEKDVSGRGAACGAGVRHHAPGGYAAGRKSARRRGHDHAASTKVLGGVFGIGGVGVGVARPAASGGAKCGSAAPRLFPW